MKGKLFELKNLKKSARNQKITRKLHKINKIKANGNRI